MGGFALALSIVAAEPGVKAQFIGGTLSRVPAKSGVRIDLSGAESLLLRSSNAEVSVAYQKINTIEYGQSVSRRYQDRYVGYDKGRWSRQQGNGLVGLIPTSGSACDQS